MSWNYSGDPQDSLLDECRFLIGDTNANAPILQDEEIEYIIATYGSNANRLKYELFRQASIVFARDIKRSLGPQSEDPTSRLDYYKEQMQIYKAESSNAVPFSPRYASPKVFNKGMQNNPPWRPRKRGPYV